MSKAAVDAVLQFRKPGKERLGPASGIWAIIVINVYELEHQDSTR